MLTASMEILPDAHRKDHVVGASRRNLEQVCLANRDVLDIPAARCGALASDSRQVHGIHMAASTRKVHGEDAFGAAYFQHVSPIARTSNLCDSPNYATIAILLGRCHEIPFLPDMRPIAICRLIRYEAVMKNRSKYARLLVSERRPGTLPSAAFSAGTRWIVVIYFDLTR